MNGSPPDVLAVTAPRSPTLLANPFNGPMAAVRVGLLGDDFVLTTQLREIERSGMLDWWWPASPSGVVMVEAERQTSCRRTETVIDTIDFGYESRGRLESRPKQTSLPTWASEQVIPG